MSAEYNYLDDLPTDAIEYLKNKGIRVQGFENRSLWNLKGVEQMYAKCAPIRAIGLPKPIFRPSTERMYVLE